MSFGPQENKGPTAPPETLSTASANSPLAEAVFCHHSGMTFFDSESPWTITNDYDLYVPHNPYTASELSAMAYQGVLRPQFGPYYVDNGLPDTPSQRAKSVRMVGEQLIEGSWTATLLTAAWIHLGGQAPEMFEAATAVAHRGKSRSTVMPTALRHCDYLGDDSIHEDDLRVIGGVVVTSPELTIEDLLRLGGRARHQDQARRLGALTDRDRLEQRLTSAGLGPEAAHILEDRNAPDLQAV